MPSRLLFLLSLLILPLFSCSTISKKDCSKDMYTFGLNHGKSGSPEKFTDELRDKCLGSTPDLKLEAYEKGFYQGWIEFCMPSKAFDMGRLSDRYISFCPAERETMFRQKYLIGKNYAELKDVEMELEERMDDLRPSANSSISDEYNQLKLELEKVKRDMQALEVEGKKNNFQYK